MSWRATGGIKRWEADKWFSECVREAAGHVCEHCRRREGTDCAHIYGRAKFSTRWCKDNAVCLCRNCHDTFGQHPLMFIDWIESTFPGRRDRLMVKVRGILKNNPANRKLISAHYRTEHRRMVSEKDANFESWN